MTPAALLISLAGLSHREASDFLGSRIDTVQSYFRRTKPKNAPPGVLDELRGLISRQEAAAREALTIIAQQVAARPDLDAIEIGYPVDDHEAQALGFPCVGAWQAMAARVIAGAPIPVRLVPRGTTTATAAAADIHEKNEPEALKP